MNKRGGGVLKINDFDAPDMKLFKGGLKNARHGESRLTYGTNTVADSHDHMDYERVIFQILTPGCHCPRQVDQQPEDQLPPLLRRFHQVVGWEIYEKRDLQKGN